MHIAGVSVLIRRPTPRHLLASRRRNSGRLVNRGNMARLQVRRLTTAERHKKKSKKQHFFFAKDIFLQMNKQVNEYSGVTNRFYPFK